MSYDKEIRRILNELSRREINCHSILITERGKTLYEAYYAPFTENTPHRMYSVTKSFVALAIGCLVDEGKLKLSDRIVSYFPDKLPVNPTKELLEQTVRDMLIMNTCMAGVNWFQPGVIDRCACYFSAKTVRPAGTIFDYDSTGSYVLGVLVERLSGKKLLDYMKEKFLDEIGGFENAEILETPDGTPWGDSALICTTRALEHFARLLMQKGEWNGKQLISREYVEAATSFQTENGVNGVKSFDTYGYGYQIWLHRDGFFFYGMGGQHAIVIPEKNLIFVCTGDNQFNSDYGERLFEIVLNNLSPAVENTEDYPEKTAINVAHGEKNSIFENEVNGAWFTCKENPMGITRFRVCFTENGGTFEYINAQGEKQIEFGRKCNVYGVFPQYGYSNDRGNVHELTDFLYKDAVSAGWLETQKLQIWVQIIDRYFGTLMITIGWRDKDSVGIRMIKAAEDFLNEYDGWLCAYREQ